MRDLEYDPNSSIYSISIVKRSLDLVIGELKATGSSLITLVIDSLDSKKGAKEREFFTTVCLWMELIDSESRYATYSTNPSAIRGIKVKRDGRLQSWKIVKTFTDDKYLAILSSVLAKVDSSLSNSIREIVESEKSSIIEKKEKLKSIGLSSIINESGSFTLKPTELSSTAATEYFSPIKEEDDIPTSMDFIYERFNRNRVRLSSQRVRLSVCLSQQRALHLFFNTFVGNTMTGELSERGNVEYVMKMCFVLNTILDSSKLRVKIDKMKGVQDEEDEFRMEEDEEEEEVVDDEGEDIEEEVALDFTNPTVLTSLFHEEIECEKDRVVFRYGESVKKKKNASLRTSNALSAMGLIGRVMQKFKYRFLGGHVDEQYANKFLKVKFEAEIKSFLTQLNPPAKYDL
jgi:hypothetical protein